MQAVDKFVIYDNIQYTKKGWINRNRILVNGTDQFITVPIKKDSDYLNIVDRSVSDTWYLERKKMLNKITEAYRKAPNFKQTIALIEECLYVDKSNLFEFLYHSILKVRIYLDINTPLIISSLIDHDHEQKGEKRVLSICNTLKYEQYINPIGGIDLYNKENFKQKGIQLSFIKPKVREYKQFNHPFIPS